MEIIIDDSFESPTCKLHEEVEDKEPGYLLEKSWFFGNLLDRRKKMSRCYSDPYPCSNLTDHEEMLDGKSYEETYSSVKKVPHGDMSTSPGLIRTPSLPEESTHQAKGSNQILRGSKSRQQASSNNLFRAPSFPTSIGREEIQDEESDFSMSKLIRQASLKHSDMLPPRRVPKGLNQSSSTPRQLLRGKTDLESIKIESPEGIMMRTPPSLSRTKLVKSSNDLIGELQGFKDLSIKFDNQDLGPGLPEKKQQLQFGPSEDKARKSYLSDQAWQSQSSSSPIGKRSVEDMKAQIKFWARAVASNVRQEC